MQAIFVSDLHLSAERPQRVDLFLALLDALPPPCRLFILGDLFEIWLGDDDISEPHPRVLAGLRHYSDRGGELYVMRGNRDFLFGKDFAIDTGATLLDDYHRVELGGEPVLLTHGDLLCTKDVKYQAFRKYVRDPNMQRDFLAHPLAERRRIAAHTQTNTKASMLEKDDFIMDVEQSTVAQTMTDYGVSILIHGHTHRPGDHNFQIGNQQYRRLVLGDWYDEDSIIVWHDGEFSRTTARTVIESADAVGTA